MIVRTTTKARDGRRIDRRNFLRGAGGALITLPFLSSLWPKSTSAAPNDDAVSLLTIYQACGVAQSNWWPATGAGALSDASFPEGHSFEDLRDHADRLLFVRGLDNVPHLGGCDHHRVIASALSAQPHREDQGGNAGNTDSIDSLIARFWDPADRPPLVLLGGLPNGGKYNTGTHVDGEPLTGLRAPSEAYAQIAGIFPEDDPSQQVDAQLERGKSVLDFVHQELCSLKTHELSAADRIKLEAYSDSLRGVELDLTGQGSSTCQPPLEDYGPYDDPPNDTSGQVAYAEMLLDIAVLAAVCGHRRAVTFYMGGEAPRTVYDFLGASCEHHGLSHHTCSGDASGPFDAGSDALMQGVDRFHAGTLLKRVLDQLTSFQGEGVDALTNTGVLMLSGLSDGRTHSHKEIPLVLAGGMGGYFKQGELVELGSGGSIGNGTLCDSDACVPHNRFLAMLAAATGIELAHFGHADLPDGEHSELRS